jgi:hypothetical protein
MAAKPWIIKPLVLPVADKAYEVHPVDYQVGLSLVAVQRGTSTTLTEDTEDAVLFALVMGDTWQQMMDDRQPFPVMFRAGIAALQFQTSLIAGIDNDEAVAIGERVWETGSLPEALAATTAALPETSTRSQSSDAAPSTRPRASTSTTKSQTATKRTPPRKAAPRSPGKRSASNSR